MTTQQLHAAPPAASLRSRFAWAVSDSLVLSGRATRHLLRNPELMIVATMLPLAQLIVFRYLFGGAIQTGSVDYASYMIAGLIVISVGFNASNTSVSMANDLAEGIVDRFRSMPMVSTSLLTGHVMGSLARHILSMTVIVLAGLAVGFRPEAGVRGWLAAVGLLLIFATTISWLSVIFAVVTKSVEGASGLSLILVFVPYASSAFVPTHTMPSVLQGFANNQPFTPLIDAVRGLLLDLPIGNDAWVALAWWSGLLVVTVPLAGLLFRRRTSA